MSSFFISNYSDISTIPEKNLLKNQIYFAQYNCIIRHSDFKRFYIHLIFLAYFSIEHLCSDKYNDKSAQSLYKKSCKRSNDPKNQNISPFDLIIPDVLLLRVFISDGYAKTYKLDI